MNGVNNQNSLVPDAKPSTIEVILNKPEWGIEALRNQEYNITISIWDIIHMCILMPPPWYRWIFDWSDRRVTWFSQDWLKIELDCGNWVLKKFSWEDLFASKYPISKVIPKYTKHGAGWVHSSAKSINNPIDNPVVVWNTELLEISEILTGIERDPGCVVRSRIDELLSRLNSAAKNPNNALYIPALQERFTNATAIVNLVRVKSAIASYMWGGYSPFSIIDIKQYFDDAKKSLGDDHHQINELRNTIEQLQK